MKINLPVNKKRLDITRIQRPNKANKNESNNQLSE